VPTLYVWVGLAALFEKEKICFPCRESKRYYVDFTVPAVLAGWYNEFLHPGSERFPVALGVSNSPVILCGQALQNCRYCNSGQ
jgi:hypothetical protein